MKATESEIRKLDQVDRKLIGLLQKDGRMPTVTLAKTLGISETTARSRLKRLIREEIISVVAVSNPIRLGFEIIGNIKLSIDLKKKDNTFQRFYEHWILGRDAKVQTPRWSVIRNVLGWVD